MPKMKSKHKQIRAYYMADVLAARLEAAKRSDRSRRAAETRRANRVKAAALKVGALEDRYPA